MIKASYDFNGITIYDGNCIDVLKEMPDESVQMCVTSPPYWGLRDYGIPETDWGDWTGCYGLEPDPFLYIKHTVDIFNELRKVLKKDGVLWLNLGDSYISNPHMDIKDSKYGDGRNRIDSPNRKKINGFKSKDLCMIPARVAIALQESGWYLRSQIPWIKRNCMPESAKDRPTVAIEYFFLLSKSRKYYYDYEAIKLPSSQGTHPRYAKSKRKPVGWNTGKERHDTVPKGRYDAPGVTPKSALPSSGIKSNTDFNSRLIDVVEKRARRNSDWFFESFQGLLSDDLENPMALIINSKGTAEAHFATFPEKLIEPCILAGSKIGDVILDPFGGSGTTAKVAKRLNRKATLIDLNPEYCKMPENTLNQINFINK